MFFVTAAATVAVLAAGTERDEPAPKPPTAAASPALAGIVTDQTLTLAGQEFYRQFCMFWHDKPQSEVYAITVRERLSARRGNQVVIEYAGRVMFQGALPPLRAGLAVLGQQAVDSAYESVVNAEVQRLLFTQDELGPDEF